MRSSVKLVVRLMWTFELWWRRRLAKARGRARYQLAGSCERCAKCCEEPTIYVGPLVYYVPFLRAPFLWWQQHVNGFELVRTQREEHLVVFHCTHFDRATRQCDSYASRPFMCRDYPRLILDQAWPELFEACGYRAVDTQGAGMLEALNGLDIPAEQKAKLRRRLHLVK